MSTAGRPDADAPAASDVAARLRDAGFVRLVADATGDGVAAAGLLASALDESGVPAQASVDRLPAATERATDADCTVALGRPATDADVTLGVGERPASAAAFEVAEELGDADPVLALAGSIAAGGVPDELLAAVDIERRPGVAVPTEDRADGLAHSTLVHAPFSGSVERAAETLDEASADSDDAGRRVASAVALAVAGDEAGVSRAATSVERSLRPFVGGPFETVGGYGDVLDAAARERPGRALALALGADVSVLSTWRDHGQAAHAAVREARTGRYDGLFVARCAGTPPVGTVARLVHEYRSPEPVTLVVGETEAAARATTDAATHLGTALGEAAASVGGEGGGTRTRARATVDGDSSEFVLGVRDQL